MDMNGLNGQQPQQPETIDGRQIPVLLDIEAWQTILNLLGEGPWKAANPLIGELTKQINAELDRRRRTVGSQGTSQLRPGVTT